MSIFNDDVEIHPDGSYSVDSSEEYFYDSDDSDDYDEKIQMKKIEFINLFLGKTSELISIHPEIYKKYNKFLLLSFSKI